MKSKFFIAALIVSTSLCQFANAQTATKIVDPATGKETVVSAPPKNVYSPANNSASVNKTFFTTMQNMNEVMKVEKLSSTAKMVSYKITIVSKGVAPGEFECKGNDISAEAKKAFATLKSGDKVYFEYILVSEGSEMKKIQPKYYIVI